MHVYYTYTKHVLSEKMNRQQNYNLTDIAAACSYEISDSKEQALNFEEFVIEILNSWHLNNQLLTKLNLFKLGKFIGFMVR